jgi:hypothetical protein
MKEITALICIISIPASVGLWGILHMYYTQEISMEGYRKSDKAGLIIAIIELCFLMIGAIIIKL